MKYIHRFNNEAELISFLQAGGYVEPWLSRLNNANNINPYKFNIHTSGTVNNVNYVDMGLPSGTLWQSMNLGATTIYDAGSLFAWGETETKSNYSWSNYKYCNGTYNTLTKYNSNSSLGSIDNIKELELSDDIINITYGNGWHIPSASDVSELLSTSNTTKSIQNNYIQITSKINGNKLFFPRNRAMWTSSLRTTNNASSSAYILTVTNEEGTIYFELDDDSRCIGYCVRGVKK